MKSMIHIGVQRSGQVIDDLWLGHATPKDQLQAGSSGKSQLVLPGAPFQRLELFSCKEKSPAISFVDGQQGEIALDGKTPAPLDALKAKARAFKADATAGAGPAQLAGWRVDLPEGARGWIKAGDAVFFFDVGAKPPRPPKGMIVEKRGFLAGIEKVFASALIGMLMLEGGFIAYVNNQPEIDVEKPSEEDLDRFAEILMPEKPVEEPKKDEEDDAKKKAEDDAKKKAEDEAKKKAEEEAKKKADEEKEKKAEADPAAAAKAEEQRKAALKEAVTKTGLLNVLGSAGSGGGALANLFAQSSGFGDDVEKALNESGGVKVATGAEDASARRGAAGGGGPVGIGDLNAAAGAGGGGNVVLAEKKKVAAPQIDFGSADDVEVEGGSVSKEAVMKFIKTRIKSVQGCYEKELKLNPTLKGKIVVRFVISPEGKISDASIDQNTMGNDNVGACIVRTVRAWTLPFKAEEETPITFPFVFTPGG